MSRSTAIIVVLGAAAAAWATGQAVVAPVAVTVPQYSASYVPEAQDPHADRLAAIESRLRRIEDKLDAVLQIARDGAGPETVGTPSPKTPDPLRTAAAKCNRCHGVAVFEEKAGGMQLFNADGRFHALTNRDRRKLVAMVESGKMPPPEAQLPLSDAEKAALLNVFRPTPAPVPAPTPIPPPAPAPSLPQPKGG